MSTDLSTYRRDLILALRLRDVPGDRIGEIVAEVESHVADTGEDPREAFGAPKEYAASLPGGRRSASRWWSQVLLAVASGLGGFLLAAGILGLVDGGPVGPLPAEAAVALGVVIGVPVVAHVRRSTSPVQDPRTGQEMLPVPRWVPWAVAGVLVAPVVVGVVVIAATS